MAMSEAGAAWPYLSLYRDSHRRRHGPGLNGGSGGAELALMLPLPDPWPPAPSPTRT